MREGRAPLPFFHFYAVFFQKLCKVICDLVAVSVIDIVIVRENISVMYCARLKFVQCCTLLQS